MCFFGWCPRKTWRWSFVGYWTDLLGHRQIPPSWNPSGERYRAWRFGLSDFMWLIGWLGWFKKKNCLPSHQLQSLFAGFSKTQIGFCYKNLNTPRKKTADVFIVFSMFKKHRCFHRASRWAPFHRRTPPTRARSSAGRSPGSARSSCTTSVRAADEGQRKGGFGEVSGKRWVELKMVSLDLWFYLTSFSSGRWKDLYNH